VKSDLVGPTISGFALWKSFHHIWCAVLVVGAVEETTAREGIAIRVGRVIVCVFRVRKRRPGEVVLIDRVLLAAIHRQQVTDPVDFVAGR